MLVLRYFSFAADMGDEFMRLRMLAQLQVSGVDMNASGLSKLEGQIRFVTDFELVALADILDVSVDWLLGRTQQE